MTEKGKTVLRYLELDQFKNETKLGLAKIIHKENPGLFKTVENARDAVRRLKGSHGDRQRKRISVKDHFTRPGEEANNKGIPNPFQNVSYKRETPAKILVFDIETSPMEAYGS